ncbi:hypothetical protein ACOMHN_021048 [Nucella lapillus]
MVASMLGLPMMGVAWTEGTASDAELEQNLDRYNQCPSGKQYPDKTTVSRSPRTQGPLFTDQTLAMDGPDLSYQGSTLAMDGTTEVGLDSFCGRISRSLDVGLDSFCGWISRSLDVGLDSFCGRP